MRPEDIVCLVLILISTLTVVAAITGAAAKAPIEVLVGTFCLELIALVLPILAMTGMKIIEFLGMNYRSLTRETTSFGGYTLTGTLRERIVLDRADILTAITLAVIAMGITCTYLAIILNAESEEDDTENNATEEDSLYYEGVWSEQ